MKNNRKAQAALEFLMTYGWAFMVILIMIAALAYFGVLNPDRILPDRATVPHPFQHMSGELRIAKSDTNTFGVGMMNSFGRPIVITNVSVSTDYGSAPDNLYCELYNGTIDVGGVTQTFNQNSMTGALTWPDGKTGNIFVNCTGNSGRSGANLPEGSRIKAYIDIKWYSASSTASFSQLARIELSAVVQEI
jgi:hypothetical protein